MSRSSSLSPHDHMLLSRWGRQLYEAFGEMPYLVGSVARADERWRDVDVRIKLPDDAQWLIEFDFDAAIQSIRLRTINLAVSMWGRQVTGLPIDFQFQPASEFHSYGDGVRHALGIEINHVVQETWDRRQALADASNEGAA